MEVEGGIMEGQEKGIHIRLVLLGPLTQNREL